MTVNHDYCKQQYLSKKHKDNTRFKAWNILILKFLKESSSENNVMRVEIIFTLLLNIIYIFLVLNMQGHYSMQLSQKNTFLLEQNNCCDEINNTRHFSKKLFYFFFFFDPKDLKCSS